MFRRDTNDYVKANDRDSDIYGSIISTPRGIIASKKVDTTHGLLTVSFNLRRKYMEIGFIKNNYSITLLNDRCSFNMVDICNGYKNIKLFILSDEIKNKINSYLVLPDDKFNLDGISSDDIDLLFHELNIFMDRMTDYLNISFDDYWPKPQNKRAD